MYKVTLSKNNKKNKEIEELLLKQYFCAIVNLKKYCSVLVIKLATMVTLLNYVLFFFSKYLLEQVSKLFSNILEYSYPEKYPLFKKPVLFKTK